MLVSLFLLAALAREPVPEPYVAVGVGRGMPAQRDGGRASVQPGETITLRAMLFGGQRAWCMYPERHAPIGRNTTMTHRGPNGCGYEVTTEGYHNSGSWSVTRERYGWTAPGATVTASGDGEVATLIAPDRPGELVVSVTGEVTWKLDSVAKREVTDRGYGTITLTIAGSPPPALDPAEARARLLRSYETRIPPGVRRGEGLTWVTSPGFANNVWDLIGYDGFGATTCGGYQDQVLRLLDGMRTSGTDAEREIFDHYDYGPVQAYYGGHQAVVIYPKGTDWTKTGTVLDPWPEQRPETYSMKAWNERFQFGVGPSGVYAGQYPNTGGKGYPEPQTKLSAEQIARFRALPKAEQDRLRAMTPAARKAALDATPDPERVSVSVHSPVRLLVRDEAGRRVGTLPGGRFVYEIPGTDVDLFPEPDGSRGAVFFLPAARYDVFAEATAPGTFDLAWVKPEALPGETIQRWEGLRAVPGQQVAVTLRPDDPNLLTLRDAEGRLTAPTVDAPAAGGGLDGLRCSAVGGGGFLGAGGWALLALMRRRR